MDVISLVNEQHLEEKPSLLASLSREEIHELCRSCLTQGVFENNFRWPATSQSDDQNLSFAQLYKLLMDIKVRDDDNLPQKLCNKCSEELIRFHCFRNNCLKSEQTLRSALSATYDTKPLLVKSEDGDVSPTELLEQSDCSKDADVKHGSRAKRGENEGDRLLLQQGTSERVSVKDEIVLKEIEDDVGNVPGASDTDEDDTPISDTSKNSENLSRTESTPARDLESYDNALSTSPALTLYPESTLKQVPEICKSSCMKLSISPTRKQDPETRDCNYIELSRRSTPTQTSVTCDSNYMKISISPTRLQDTETCNSYYLETSGSPAPTRISETCDKDYMDLSRSPSPTQNIETCNSDYIELRRGQTPTQDVETCGNSSVRPTENLPLIVIPESTSTRKIDKEDTGDCRGRRKHHCLFCGLFVSNFYRHIQRNHWEEIRVQKIMALKKFSKERKKLIDKLRHEGDFCSAKVVPVRNEANPRPDKIICKFCSGYYSQKSLHRHAKKCYFNPDPSARFSAQIEGQTIMAGRFGPNDPLRTCGLLRIMRADNISFVAKKDPVICEVGRKYLRCRKDKRSLVVAKTQMRRLARLLISAREILENDDLQLSDLLSPAEFKTLVAATHEISEYDEVTRTYKSPSLALHMRSLIRNAISAAQSFELHREQSSPKRLETLTSLNRLMQTDWAIEVPCEAGQNFAPDTFNKPILIPVAEDILKFQTYLRQLIVTSRARLEDNSRDGPAYRDLVDAIFCGVMIFNKERLGDLQTMTVASFTNNLNVPTSSDSESSLTVAEKILNDSLKRVMVRGKLGIGVPIFFDQKMVEAIEFSISLRENFSLQDSIYLFGLPGSQNPISGHIAMRKHCRIALGDGSRAALLTSTKFRKHLATIAQILSMDRIELEQLATFMGHSEQTRAEFYRLPDDIHETAKLSKLVLLAQRGTVDKYKGKQLRDIEIDDEMIEDDGETADDEKEACTGTGNATETEAQDKDLEEPVGASGVLIKKGKKRTLTSWTDQQKKLTEEFFKSHIKKRKPPKKDEVMGLIGEHPRVFHNKAWQVVKVYVCNKYNKK